MSKHKWHLVAALILLQEECLNFGAWNQIFNNCQAFRNDVVKHSKIKGPGNFTIVKDMNHFFDVKKKYKKELSDVAVV